ncbi:MAG: deoxyribodipyrimidine photo-lyase [Bacteroidota bacterium]
MSSPINPKRVQTIKELPHQDGTVVYWMERDKRVNDNWALLFAQSLGMKYKMSIAVVVVLPSNIHDATERTYGFILKGFQETVTALREKNIPLYLFAGSPEKVIPLFVKEFNVTKLVTDFNPLNNIISYKNAIAENVNASIYDVDTHNIVPARFVSNKQEFAAYTIRPKIHRLLPEFLDEFPAVRTHPFDWPFPVPEIHWDMTRRNLKIDRTIKEVGWIEPGEIAGRESMQRFLGETLQYYGTERNDPTKNAQSDLSPYIHFGHLAPQRVALEVVKLSGATIQELTEKKENGVPGKHSNDKAYLEELIVRRELADNFTFYNNCYDRFEGFPAWAKQSINEHRADVRSKIYTLEQFENAKTDDELWNAAQEQMVATGKMHGYMRMYWAKKILEWTPSVEEAMVIAIYLNDRYELDGRDPNGYAGIAWSIGGVHDRAWPERSVFGKIRYMNYSGCKRKFAVEEYIRQVSALVMQHTGVR